MLVTIHVTIVLCLQLCLFSDDKKRSLKDVLYKFHA